MLQFAVLNLQLANLLLRMRVGHDVPVGILMERCPELYIAMLAVLKAGGCYVPLDPSAPPERLAFMLQDSGARVLLTHNGLDAKVPESATPEVSTCLPCSALAPMSCMPCTIL